MDSDIEAAIDEANLIVGSVISGNRNFEGRVHQKVKASYLASPPLVVAYAIAGSLNVDLTTEPIGFDRVGEPVMLSDVWPSDEQLNAAMAKITPEMFRERYATVMQEPRWDSIPSEASPLYPWEDDSTYIRLPSFFQGLSKEAKPIESITGAKVLLKLGILSQQTTSPQQEHSQQKVLPESGLLREVSIRVISTRSVVGGVITRL